MNCLMKKIFEKFLLPIHGVKIEDVTIGELKQLQDIIEFACKAQREADMRVYAFAYEEDNILYLLQHSEITEKDIEELL